MVIISVSAVVGTFLMKKTYTSTAVILPSSQNNSSSPIASLMGDLPMSGLLKSFDIFGQNDNSKFLTILESRRLAEKVIDKFDLIRRYEFHEKRKFYFENVLKAYYKNFKVQEDGLENIRIAVTDEDPKVAAEMANYVVGQLDSISYDLAKESARGSRVFFEERIALMSQTLDSVHTAFAEFQMKHNFIDMDQQVKSSIEALASVEAELMATEIEEEVLASQFGVNNQRLDEIKKKRVVLKNRISNYMNEGSGSLILPLRKTPELGIKYTLLYRDLKINQTLYAFLLQMYEQAKFREANDSPVVTVLEWAKPAEKKTTPKRATLCILAFFVGFTGLSTFVLAEHWFRKQKESETESFRKLSELFEHFKFKK